MQRSDFQKLAVLRLREARFLLDSGFYDGAFYLAGYAIECALKACIARKVRRYEFPPKDARDLYSHDLIALASRAEVLDLLKNGSPEAVANWTIVSKWHEQERYNSGGSEARAMELITAIADKRDGVLACLRKHW